MTFLTFLMVFNFIIFAFLTLVWKTKNFVNLMIRFIMFMGMICNAVILYRLIFMGHI